MQEAKSAAVAPPPRLDISGGADGAKNATMLIASSRFPSALPHDLIPAARQGLLSVATRSGVFLLALGRAG
jgi:hypothetical protein